MNLLRIQYFLAVVDAGTVTAAAEALHLAQPALSRQIKTLERELRLPLFEPHGNRLALTSAGRALVPAARRLLTESRDFENAAGALRDGAVAELVVATTSASLRQFLAGFIATTSPADPCLVTREVNHYEMSEALLHGADLAVSPAAPDGTLRQVALGGAPIYAYVAAGHAWAREGAAVVTLADCAGEDALVSPRTSVSRTLLDAALARAGLAFASVTECADGQTIMALAAAGRGVGFATEPPRFGAHALRVLDGDGTPLSVPLHVAWVPGHFAEAVIESLALRLRDFVARWAEA
ncbi:LysR family transcriptional regulator [Micrococcales bacterium 31B]|nr:LysR family transcriptional regulator [Micrococcales bacterium 31B]